MGEILKQEREEFRKVGRATPLPRVWPAPKKLTKRSSIIIFVPVRGIEYAARSRREKREWKEIAGVYLGRGEAGEGTASIWGLMYDGDKEERGRF